VLEGSPIVDQDIGGDFKGTQDVAKANHLIQPVGHFRLDHKHIEIAIRPGFPSSAGTEDNHCRTRCCLLKQLNSLEDGWFIDQVRFKPASEGHYTSQDKAALVFETA
jgi:hypothetical protein